MDTKIRSWFFLYVQLPLLFFSKSHLSTAAEIISLGQPLSGKRTISSKGGIFELGFFTPGNSKNYYVGIWYKQFPEYVVWVANRETPLSNRTSSELRINQNGNLLLLNQMKRTVWSTSIPSVASNSTTAELLDTGNLVLRDGSNSSVVIWQSFDYPTDTWLPKGQLGRNKITGERQRLTSWKNSEDPAPGMFSLELDPSGINQFVLMWNRSKIYWRSGVWTGQYFSSLPGMDADQHYKLTLVETQNRTYATYEFLDNTSFTRSIINPLGQIQRCKVTSSQTWSCFWYIPTSPCEIYSYCSSFGICTQQYTPAFCSCLRGFEPRYQKEWNSSIWSGGCKRRTPLHCGGNTSVDAEKDGYFVMRNVRLPGNPQSLTTVRSAKECELYCLNNCSCTAYAYDSSCSVWNGDLINLKQMSGGDVGGGDLYLRLAAIDLQVPLSEKTKGWVRWVIVSVGVGCVSVFSVVILFIWICRRRRRMRSLKVVQDSLVVFSYKEIQIITKNFSEKLGKGSFGSVFKGSLPDSMPIAVKKLEGLAQGEKQFRAEVGTIGAIQHINLIRLRGFCSQGRNRLLVYNYMPNGSLDSQLFHKNPQAIDWKIRYQIALGTARGLAYLHEKCRDCIIHCDIKPENVLLDAAFCPKLADFGMAKLVGREFSRVLTSMRGTIGYLAPEWISGVAITPKADVYSYGMMLFEIISGKRNAEQLGNGESAFFPCWAAENIVEDEVLALLDYRLDGVTDIEELRRASRVACWCIQDNEKDRPSMEHVVQILEGVRDVCVPPIPWSIKILTDKSSWISY